ncbi:MAG: hypothetical protein HGA87_01890 [Desulfobulbaceae bacterium]|nr:hypothetical protein [Desulfobulbaceae bacterium]
MARGYWSLTKDARRLSGENRARLIIKDIYEKEFGNKEGFLNDEEKQALRDIPDPRAKKDFEEIWQFYRLAPGLVSGIAESYYSLKYSLEALKKAHVLLNLSPVVSRLEDLIKDNFIDAEPRAEALKLIEFMQVVDKDLESRPVLKDTFEFIRRIVPVVAEDVRNFIEEINTVKAVNRMMGFNIFMYEKYPERCRIYVDEIKLAIDAHNRIICKFGTGMTDIDAYLIPPLDLKKTQLGVGNE